MLRLVTHHAMRSASIRLGASTRSPAVIRHARLQSTSSIPPNQGSESGRPSATYVEDWNAKVVTYEEVKPRTEQPTPVRICSFGVVPSYVIVGTGQVSD